jgi:PKD domain
MNEEGKLMQGRRPSWRVVALILVVVGAITGGAIALTSGGHSARAEREAKWTKDGEIPNARTEVAREGKETHEAKFERDKGKEGRREGPSSPAAEAVGDRAYPRNYVDDKLAARGRNAFRSLPSRPTGPGSNTRAATRAAVTGPWSELGPFTPNVAGPDSQFFDPVALTGPTTQESGRVTALAIDPACAPGNCKMWVAAAGGGIWRTNDALAAHVDWIAPPDDLQTYAFGSLIYDAAHNTLYAGSGEPNGSGDSEAGLGLYKSTDGGASWGLVPGSAAVATNRSIGAIAVDPSDPNTIYIGTDVARHGSSSVNGGRFTPPGAPALGVYKSTDGGANFTLESDLSDQTPPSPNPPESGVDWFQGGINKIELDPNDSDAVYAAVLGYGLWRSTDAGASWEKVFHTMNENDFSDPDNPVGDTHGDRTEFQLVDTGSGHTRAYVGDASDDFVLDGDDTTPLPEAWRVEDVGNQDAGDLVDDGGTDPASFNPGWTQLSSSTGSSNGFAVYGFCQNGQCGYDEFVVSPPSSPNTVWYGGSMNYDELPEYDLGGKSICAGGPTCEAPRSNGRAVVRSTNANLGTQATAADTVSWQDMTAILNDPSQAWGVKDGAGIHPDLHAIAFAQGGNTAFIGSDGGVVRIDVSSTQNQSASCAQRKWNYDPDDPSTPEVPLNAADLHLCQELLSGVPNNIEPVNDGLRDLQFQSLSFDPQHPGADLLGGTQDNGTWSVTPPSTTALETVGGDGGQSGFDAGTPTIRYHNYFDATPEVNFHGTDPTKWLDIYDPLQITDEARSFYTPFVADPKVPGRLFTGLEHVWRTDDHGGNEQDLVDNGCYAYQLNPFRTEPCGDWVQLGGNLTGNAFGHDRAGQYVVAIARAPSDNSTLWAGTRTGRVFVTNDADDTPGAVQFRRIDSASTPGRFVSGIAVDPGNPNHAWISYSGYSAYSPGGHVYDVTYNPSTRSAAFTDISHDLGDQPVDGIAEDEVSGAVFAATDFGVAELAPGTTTWTRAGTGLPGTAVFGLSLSHEGRVLYAATHGRGAYRLSLPLPAPPHGTPTGAIHGPTTLELGRKATFTATGSTPNGGSVTFHWSLPGTPSSATGTPVSFTPTKLGVQTIVLTITDGTGASAVVTQAVTVKDTKRPTIKIKRIRTVRRGHSTTVRGTITDAGGIKSAKISFGDGSRSKKLHLSRKGAFKVKHRYRRAKRYRVKVTAVDKAGHKATKTAHARVRR